MRRDVLQQLKFDNATDLAAAVAVPLPSLLYWLVVLAWGLEPGLREDGLRFSLGGEILFCLSVACGNLLVTLLAATEMQTYTADMLHRCSAQLPQLLYEFCAQPAEQTEAAAGAEAAIPSAAVPAGPEAGARCVRELGLRFGQWCRYVNMKPAPADLQLIKSVFNAFVIIGWLVYPLVVSPSIPTMALEWLLLLTISGYMSFNMGYRIGVRRALGANLPVLGVIGPQ